MPTYTFSTSIAVGDLGQVVWANSVSAALNELGPLVDTKANDSDVVKLAGNQTVAGTKTFSSAPSVPDSSFSIAKTTGLQTALDAKAPLASPTFTGTPAAPTPTTADNTTKIATTAFVKAQGYAPLASPTFTGDPKAPTPATADNDTSIATTAFVKAQGYATAAALADKLDTSAAPELIRDTIGTALVAGANITITPDDTADTITISATGSGGGPSKNFISGNWGLPGGGLQAGYTTESTLANQLYGNAFELTTIATLTGLSFSVTTASAAGGLARVGVYKVSDPSGGSPTLMASSGTIAIDTTGVKTFTTSTALTVGWYVAVILVSADVTLGVRSVGVPTGAFSSTSTTSGAWATNGRGVPTHYGASATFGTLPATPSLALTGNWSSGFARVLVQVT